MPGKVKVSIGELEPGTDPWACELPVLEVGTDGSSNVGAVRAVREGDEGLLVAFGREGLSAASRGKFECYAWMGDGLAAELRAAIGASAARQDLHLVALDDAAGRSGAVAGYVFLWAAADDVPELGLAVADAWHGRGLGSALLRLMAQVGAALGRRALELTTMRDNARALAVYKRCGWEHLGEIHNPLGCDVPAAFAGRATPSGIAVENHCVLVLDETRRAETLAAMAAKRERAAQLFPVPEGGLDAAGIWRVPAATSS
jgi:ribosomal protein S18 acetylase RimI-like enzyme